MDTSPIKHGLSTRIISAAIVCLTAGCAPDRPARGIVASPQEIKAAMQASQAPLTMVHVWATWCDPCRDEFPELLQVYRDTREKGLELVLVSGDAPTAMEHVNRFLLEQQSPVDSLVATELNQEFVEMFSPNWPGALPATFFFDSDGTLVAEWQGQRSYDEFYETIDQLLNL